MSEKVKLGGVEYEILGQLGAGGQGAVFKVKRCKDGEIYAWKTLQDKNPKRMQNKIENLNYLITNELDKKLSHTSTSQGVNHVFPIQSFVKNGETSYIMECVPGKMLGDMLINGDIDKMSFEERLKLARRIALSISILHDSGHCYTDINLGNFMWDEKADMLHVLDCENVTNSADIKAGKCFLMGTGFFIAPEVAFGKARVGFETDRYALATLIFRFFTNNVLESAYHGAAMYSAVPACMNMVEVAELDDEDDIDPNWRYYVFDPNHHENGLDNLFKNSKNPENRLFRVEIEKMLKDWQGVDDRLKELFYKAFRDPFDRKSRPTASLWISTIDKILSGPAVKAAPPMSTPPQPIAKNTPPAPPQPPTLKKATLIGSKGGEVAITEAETIVKGSDFVSMGSKEIGVLREQNGGFEFESKMMLVIDIFDASLKNKKGSLCRGQKIMLENGDRIRPGTTREMIKIKY